MKKTEELLQISNKNALVEVNKELVEKFLNGPTRYVFGRTIWIYELAQKLRIDYCTDSKVQHNGEAYSGIPLCILDEIPKNSVLLNAALGSYNTVAIILQEKGFKSISLYDLFNYDIKYIFNIFKGVKENFTENIDRYESVYNGLNDNISKKTFEDLVLYKLTINQKFMDGYLSRPYEQYFESFLGLKDGEVFVDCGGFGGETTEIFIKNCPKYKKIYLFEPSDEIEKAKLLLNGHCDIDFIKKGVWDKAETLKFNLSGTSSAISDKGEIVIHTAALDETVSEKVTFIKMDIEGAELPALKGAERIIKRDRPKLAISVYHKHDDWWRIFDYVKSIAPDYKVYLRHYTAGPCETVMFFI
ncbi:MAG: FkbM family methyltransferase [Deferribacteraceae bacterium]|nr:FkbM family methyltransferase [Deferribacteraceae bacterium]